MNAEQDIEISKFNYKLPDERIARYPLKERDRSKLLVYQDGSVTDDHFANLPAHLQSDHLLVFNNTRVIRARLKFKKKTGASIEIFCLEPSNPADHSLSFSSNEPVEWICLVGNLKRWKSGSLDMILSEGLSNVTLTAEKVRSGQEGVVIRFKWDNRDLCFSEILELAGHIPVPPYLGREDEEIDNTRYQTVYSIYNGSVAAPTAGLHFTPEVLKAVADKGIDTEEITLHVSAGTFRPVKSETIGGHTMHIEHFYASEPTVKKIAEGNIIAVGTTTVRTLESLYWLGVLISEGIIKSPGELYVDQWIPYLTRNRQVDKNEAIGTLCSFMAKHGLDGIVARTSIIIVPGYRFRIVKGLVTNFHMPGSTLLLLVSAMVGEKWRDIYNHALENGYRFLSYGDSSLLIP